MDTQETGLYYILIITSVVTSGVLLYAFITAILQQIHYRVQHNLEVESEILASEKERSWLAADMHDDLGPLLSATKMSLSAIGAKNKADLVLLEESMQQIDVVNAKIRSLARGLMPDILLQKGLQLALQQFIKTLGNAYTLSIELKLQPMPPISDNASIHLYRIIQEIIHNCLKHARANQLVIKVYTKNNELILAAADDGIGFKTFKRTHQPKGFGLTGIQNRVHLLNGRFNLRSHPGTSYFIQIPLDSLREGSSPDTNSEINKKHAS